MYTICFYVVIWNSHNLHPYSREGSVYAHFINDFFLRFKKNDRQRNIANIK